MRKKVFVKVHCVDMSDVNSPFLCMLYCKAFRNLGSKNDNLAAQKKLLTVHPFVVETRMQGTNHYPCKTSRFFSDLLLTSHLVRYKTVKLTHIIIKIVLSLGLKIYPSGGIRHDAITPPLRSASSLATRT